MSNVIRDIKVIKELAGIVYSHLKRNNITKARKELEVIIRFDEDELRRLQKAKGDKRLLEESVIVLTAAKKALRDIDSFQLSPEAYNLIEEIIKIERHELLEVKEDEIKEDGLYKFWFDEIHNAKLYHGTQHIFLEKMKHYGLTSQFSPIDAYDLKRANQISMMLYDEGLPPYFFMRGRKVIFLTISKQAAIGYAEDGMPEIIREGIGGFLAHIKNMVSDIKSGKVVIADKGITKELNRMINRYESLYKNNFPILISIEMKSKFILGRIDEIYKKMILDFNEFKKHVQEFYPCKGDYHNFYELTFIRTFGQFKINENVPYKYLKIEMI